MAFLRAFGAYLPERVVTNEEIAKLTGADPAWILSVAGIEERRFAAAHESVADLGARAAQGCLARAGLTAADLGMLIVASSTSERRFPGPAAAIAHRLRLEGTPALDLPLASAGGLFGIALAARLADAYRNILVVAAEKLSGVALQPPVERGTAVLFGDGAGACLVTAASGPAKIVDSILCSDGAFTDDLRLELSGPVQMNGRSVILQASRKIPRVISDLLARNGRTAGEVDTFLMHQANQNLIDGVARALGVPVARFYSNIRKYGNTSAASMLIAAAEWQNSASFRAGAPVVLAAFGAGFHWGAVLAVGASTPAVSPAA